MVKNFGITIAQLIFLLTIPLTAYSQTNGNIPPLSDETANHAKEYFDVLSQITMSLNGTKCEQIQRDIRSVNTPQNRMKMDFDLSSLPGAISQKIASQYQSNIQAYREANNNYLGVCKNHPLAAQANADLNELFKLSVAKADANYEKMKAESDKAMAEATKAKAEADKARAEADRAKAEADNRRAQADKAQAEARKKEAEVDKARVQAEANRPVIIAPTNTNNYVNKRDKCDSYCKKYCSNIFKGNDAYDYSARASCIDSCILTCNM